MPSKAVKKQPKKPARKAKPSAVKPASKTAQKRPSAASLALNLKSLESRLKGADTRNRNAIKALAKVVDEFKASTKRGTTTQKAALTRGLNRLEMQMETYLERSSSQVRTGIRSDLSKVTADGADQSTLEEALLSAHARLDALDKAQRDALARINRHIAGLATSVENRILAETEAREAASQALDAKIDSVRGDIEKRVDRVEEETAGALEIVGAKVAEFAEILEKRAQSSDAETAERLADLAQETQDDFSTAHNDFTARLEALEVIAAAWSPPEPAVQTMANPYLPANEDNPRMDQMAETIRALQDEIGRMSAQFAPPSRTEQPTPANIAPLPIATEVIPHPVAQDNPYAAAAQALEATTDVPPPTEISTKKVKKKAKKADSHIPEEWDPTAFSAPQQLSAAPLAPPVPAPTIAPPPTLAPPPPLAPPMASIGSHSAAALADGEPLMPAPQPVSTYADPAYAEGDDLRAEPIGGPRKKKVKKAQKPKGEPKLPISGKNLRIGALAAGVAVVGLFAAKTILGGANSNGIETASNDGANIAPAIASEPFAAQDANISSVDTAPPPPSEPIGQYAETKTPDIIESQKGTLDAAVAAGNPIAQFQKGLAQLQAGQMEEGARLIRLSANRNQPAAQYRLAKLYETGTGVTKDPVTARELIERAARGGNRIAMHDLGNYHAYGQGGLSQDMGAALDWFTKAAERGVVDSQFNVAFLREGNEGVPTDIETALFWYHIAARQGDQGAPERIAILSEQLDQAALSDIVARAARFNPKPVDEAANGIFRNVSWAKPIAAAQQANSAQILRIRDAQTLLSELGYQVGAADGIAGAKTRDAVKSFEAVNGMPETGEVTDALIEKLEIATGA